MYPMCQNIININKSKFWNFKIPLAEFIHTTYIFKNIDFKRKFKTVSFRNCYWKHIVTECKSQLSLSHCFTLLSSCHVFKVLIIIDWTVSDLPLIRANSVSDLNYVSFVCNESCYYCYMLIIEKGKITLLCSMFYYF